MVLAGCLVDSETEKEFKNLSKRQQTINSKRREFLEKIIKEKVKGFETVVITPNEIDTSNKEGIKLNEVEALAAQK